MAKINVLVFPAGEVNSVELHDALATCVNINLFGASSKERHGKYVFENYISGLPLIDAPEFISEFNRIIDEHSIDLIFPTHDTVMEFLADNGDKLHARVVNGDKKTADVCRDKLRQYELLASQDFMPRRLGEIDGYPLFARPRRGQGGVGARRISNEAEMPSDLDNYLVTEFLPGDEMSVDCLSDRYGRLTVVSPRTRARTMAGISAAGKTIPLTDDIFRMASVINEKLKLKGLWFFQVKKDAKGNWKFLEVASRVASTMCLTRARGVNLPLLSVYVAMGLDVSVSPNPYSVEMDRTLITRYRIDYEWATVYFDFDDTLIVRGKVNLKAIWFLYQCQNEGKRVILLTKHANEIYESMRKYKIDKSLFDEVIHIGMEEKKSKYVDPNGAIFIDNAYQERADVQSVHHIPVFDVDGMEVLMDWRI